ncbi:hypothetical protein [uncultured Gulosibacter sp.]|uniref:hypothetical protein n=1 Tax=uncultured Gulosibacter sp. TaxID=1339167 RepID=UPI00288B9F4C|nr:hypothetical protein [uncultured Gulosibacter sp.]
MRLFHRHKRQNDVFRIRAYEVRGEPGELMQPIFWVTFTAWLLSFFLFYFATGMLDFQLHRIGFIPVLFGWVVMSFAIAAGYTLGYRIMLALTGGSRMFGEREVTRLSIGDAFASACGGLVISALPAVTVSELFLFFTWVMVVGVCFTFSQLQPRYVARWREIAALRGH